MKFILTGLYLCIFIMISCNRFGPPLTKDRVQELLRNSSKNQEKLTPGIFNGCVLVPATDFIQRLLAGAQLNGETCSLSVNRNNTVRVDFLENTIIPVVSASTKQAQTDIFIGQLKNNQLLIIQHYQGAAMSITQTVYDENDIVVYGSSGEGSFIKFCDFQMTGAELAAGQKNCRK